jgi:transposase, IS5 family
VIALRRAQRSFGDGLITAEVKDLHEVWMRQVDALLEDDAIVGAVDEALARRHPNSRRRGRRGTAAEVVLRLLILKHVRNWSYAVLEREMRANLVDRDFTRVGDEKMPDAKTMGRWGFALGPAVIKQIHDRIVQLAQAQDLVPGRRMRVDTTLGRDQRSRSDRQQSAGDGVRVLTRTMKKIVRLAGTAGARLRDRSRSVKRRLLEIGRAVRGQATPNRERLQRAYGRLLETTGRVVGQARRFSQEIAAGVKRCTELVAQTVLEGLRQALEAMIPRVRQVIRQTKSRIFAGDNHSAGKLVSLFEPSIEVIRKGKTGKPTEFGKLVKPIFDTAI